MTTMASTTIAVVCAMLIAYSIFVVWVIIGASFDLRALLRDLKQERVDTNDDGFVELDERVQL